MQRGSFLVSEVVRYSPRSIVPWAGPYRGKLSGVRRNSSCTLSRGRKKDLEIQHLSWQKDGNPACGWESDFTDEHIVRTDDGVVFCAKCTTTRREQLVRREPQGSHRDPTEAKVDDNR